MKDAEILIAQETLLKLEQYKQKLQTEGLKEVGAYFKAQLQSVGPIERLSTRDFLFLLLASKKPQIFAESAVTHTIADWSPIEASILGDITINMRVTMYNDGQHHRAYINHEPPLTGAALAYVPGALLISSSPDYQEVVTGNQLKQEQLTALYQRRLLPQLVHINEQAQRAGKKAVITMPGIGTGCFAGHFQGGVIKAAFRDALKAVLTNHASALPAIDVVHYDAFSGDERSNDRAGHIQFRVRASRTAKTTSQLEFPSGTSSATHLLTSFVAWDHFSFPGNDYWAGSRATDDGVKGASTDTMFKITGIAGGYDSHSGEYKPPEGYLNWSQVASKEGVSLNAPVFVVDKAGQYTELDAGVPISDSVSAQSTVSPAPNNSSICSSLKRVAELQDKTPSSDHIFYLNGLSTLMVAGGVGMLVAAVVLSNAWLLLAGVVSIGTGVAIYGLFGESADKREEVSANIVHHSV
ncbi:MAG: hypothetical protein P1U61_08715 [Legionellaceae bacterium]|nr:hypothetical protein [Legionellaceae bacterium]